MMDPTKHPIGTSVLVQESIAKRSPYAALADPEFTTGPLTEVEVVAYSPTKQYVKLNGSWDGFSAKTRWLPCHNVIVREVLALP